MPPRRAVDDHHVSDAVVIAQPEHLCSNLDHRLRPLLVDGRCNVKAEVIDVQLQGKPRLLAAQMLVLGFDPLVAVHAHRHQHIAQLDLPVVDVQQGQLVCTQISIIFSQLVVCDDDDIAFRQSAALVDGLGVDDDAGNLLGPLAAGLDTAVPVHVDDALAHVVHQKLYGSYIKIFHAFPPPLSFKTFQN